MSEFFAEATIQLRPDLTGFITSLRTQVKAAIDTVETGANPPTIRVRPALTRDFVGNLRKQTNVAVAQAGEKVTPIPIIVTPTLSRDFVGRLRKLANDAIRQANTKLVPLRVPVVLQGIERQLSALLASAERAATAAPVVARPRAAEVSQHPLAASGDALTRAREAVGLTKQQSQAEKELANQRKRTSQSNRSAIETLERSSQSARTLVRVEDQVAAAHTKEAGSTDRLRIERRALENVTIGLAQVERELQAATRITGAPGIAATQQLRTVRERMIALERSLAQSVEVGTSARIRQEEAEKRVRKSIQDSNKALREQQREQTRSARSQEQLRRGAASTGLSFLGIRGATLAASASFLAGAAALTVFAKALQNASEFNDQINVFRATAGATAQEMERVRDAARALGADITLPGVGAADAAEAMVELAKAGLNVEESIDGARGVLQLATAAAIENAQAVELAANALNAFGLVGRDATRVADTFANAANAAQGSIVDIGIAFQQAAAAGRQVGLSFEDTTTFLTILQREGLRGSDAGTSLRTALIRLIRPTKQASERLRELGVEVRDAQGNLRPDIFLQLAAATENLSPAARDATIALVGGQDAFRAISILGRQSAEDFIQLRRELREQGTAADLASARMQGLRGSLEALANQLSTAGTRIGQGITPAIQSMVVGLSSFVAAMSTSEDVSKTFAGTVDFVEISLSALATTLQAVAVVAVPVAGAFADIAGAVGVPSILAAVAAYKLIPAIIGRATAAFVGLRTVLLGIQATAGIGAAITGASTLRTAMLGLAGSLPAVGIAAGAAAAGLLFLITREDQAERAARKLEEATDALVSALDRQRAASREAADLGLGVTRAQLGVFEAQSAVATARTALSQSRAAQGTFARRKLELQLAVALDDVTAAQERYRRAVDESNGAQVVAAQANRNLRQARAEEIESLRDVLEVERIRSTAGRLRGPGDAPSEQAAQERFIETLRQRAREERAVGDLQNILLAERIELLANLAQAIDGFPAERAVSIVINADNTEAALNQLVNAFGPAGEEARARFAQELSGEKLASDLAKVQRGFRRLFAPFLNISRETGTEAGMILFRAANASIQSQGDNLATTMENVMSRALARAQARLAGLRRQALDITIAGGGEEERLANLQQQAAAARQELAAREQQQRAGDIGFEQVTAAKENLASILTEIRSIQDQMDADAKQAAQEAKDRREQRDRDILEALGFSRDDAQERITDAQATEGLRDDIRRTRQLRQLVLRQIETIGERIKTAELRISAIRELRRISRDLQREIRQLQQQQQEELRERAAERLQLNIEFAQLTENRSAEIRARQAEIRRLKRLQAETRKGTNEYLRLRNLIAEQERAIKDLKDQQEQKNDRFKELAFAFLQSQQGFAANLIGNLIPGDLTGGLVGTRDPLGTGRRGGIPVAGGRDLADLTRKQPPPGIKEFGGGLAEALLADRRTADAAGRAQGITSGQGNTQIDLLRKILVEVRRGNRSSDHPEAKEQRKTGSAALDYGGAISMGM